MQEKDRSHTYKNPSSTAEFSGVIETNEEIKIGDFVQVVDNSTGKVVIQGQIAGNKTDPSPEHKLVDEERLMSVDCRHFFKLDDCAYTVRKLEANYVDENFISDNYNECPWGRYDYEDRNEVNMYRDFNIEELDDEMVYIVGLINRFSPYMHTEGSCSGHGDEQAWVSIIFEDASALNDFLDVLVPFKKKIDLTTDEHINVGRTIFCDKPFFPRRVELCLKTKEVGSPAWQALDELAEYLNLIIEARDKSFKLIDKIITRQFETSVLGKGDGESES